MCIYAFIRLACKCLKKEARSFGASLVESTSWRVLSQRLEWSTGSKTGADAQNTLAERGMSWCVWIVSHFCAALLEVRITGVRKALGKLVDGGGWSGDDWCTLCVLVGTPAPFKHTNIDWLLQGVIHRDTCQPTNQIIWENTVFLMPHPDFFALNVGCSGFNTGAIRQQAVPPELYPILLKLLSYLAFGRWWTHAYIIRKNLWEVLYGYIRF